MTTASNSGNLSIIVENYGLSNVTVDFIAINGTSINLNNFTIDFEIEALIGQANFTMVLDDLVLMYGIFNSTDIEAGKKLELYVRTEEGAEDTYIITIIA